MKRLSKRLNLIKHTPITHEALLEVGYKYYEPGHYCAPYPADGATYRLELKATVFENKGDGKGLIPKQGTEEWRAYITYADFPTIRRFKTMSELNYFHKGMSGEWLF